MTLGTRTQLLASAALLSLAASTPAQAQTPPAQTEEQVQQQQPPTANQGVGDQNEQAIIVTAQKRPQVLLQVPSSVTVVGGETLDRQQARSFRDYVSLVPGFSVESSSAGVSRITLRGANTGGVASTVAIFMDDVPFGSSTGLANGAILSGDFDPFDLNRIEVLRGPQGTLYGASSFGGVLKYVPNAPRLDHFEVRAQAGLEDTKGGGVGYNSAGVINAPLGQKAAVRVSGFYRKDHGYIDSIGNNPIFSLPELFPGFPNPPLPIVELGRTLVAENINDRKSFGGRASFLFEPTSDVSVRLTAFAQDLNSGAGDTFEVDPLTFQPLYGGLVQSRYQPEPTHIKYRVYNGTLDWNLGFANLFSSTAYSTFSEKFQTDDTFALAGTINLLANLGFITTTGAPVVRPLGVQLFQTTKTNKFSQEVRLSSPNNQTIEWLIGAFYTHEKSGINPQNLFATEFGTSTVAPDIIPIALIFLNSKYEETAGFANATWHMAPRFDLSVGGRLAHNKQRADLQIHSDVLGNSEGTNLRSSETVFTYSVAPRFEVNKHTSIYARVASGYRPGGPNVIPAGSPPDTPRTYKADRLTNWELGLKAEAPDHHLWSAELAAYHINWKNIQLFAIVNQTGINENGGKARVNGLEFAGAYRPVAGLTLAANGAYTSAKLLEDTPPASGGLKGDPLPWVPKWSGALHGDYEFPISSFKGFVGASVTWVGKRVTNLNERRASGGPVWIPSYTAVDLRGGVNVSRLNIEAYVHNLFNKRGLTDAAGFDGATFPNGAAGVAAIRPRTIGIAATVHY